MRELTLDELRSTQLQILDAIAEHCVRNGIRFYLCAGTLLGAVRHEGYIPWDDDIDIMLPRTDFERLCRAIGNSHLAVHSPSTSAEYPFPFAKICDRRTRIEVESDVLEGLGVYVDAFPLDGWCRNALARAAQRRLILALDVLMRVKHMQQQGTSRGRAKNAILRLAKFLIGPLSPRSISAALTWTVGRSPFETSDLVGVAVWGYHEALPHRYYGTPSTVTFEGRACPAPADTAGVLAGLYGDYMTPPPEADRATHHRFKAYALN